MKGTLVILIAVLALVACGGSGTKPSTSHERVHFRAGDGVRLDGRRYGEGSAGVVLAHMGRGGDSQLDWAGLARALAGRGYVVLTYDRRGVCPGGAGGCSQGVDDYSSSWKDIVGAVRFLRQLGVEKTVVIGASIGATAALFAASESDIDPAGLVEFGGINHASGYDFTQAEINRIDGSKLFLSSRDDIYGGGDAAREWYRWASEPKGLELVPGSEHGTDLL